MKDEMLKAQTQLTTLSIAFSTLKLQSELMRSESLPAMPHTLLTDLEQVTIITESVQQSVCAGFLQLLGDSSQLSALHKAPFEMPRLLTKHVDFETLAFEASRVAITAANKCDTAKSAMMPSRPEHTNKAIKDIYVFTRILFEYISKMQDIVRSLHNNAQN